MERMPRAASMESFVIIVKKRKRLKKEKKATSKMRYRESDDWFCGKHIRGKCSPNCSRFEAHLLNGGAQNFFLSNKKVMRLSTMAACTRPITTTIATRLRHYYCMA
jgi:hypothetical protein